MRNRGDKRCAIIFGMLFAIAATVLASCVPPPPSPTRPIHNTANDQHPLHDRLWSRDGNQFITSDTALNHMIRARFVLLGELHDNPHHHALQQWVIRALGERNNKRALAIEMIADDQIPALNLFYEQPRHNADSLRVFLQWDKSSWPTWAYYGPIFDTAVLVDYPIRAANLDRTLLKDLHRKGWQALPQETRDALQIPAALPEPLGQALRATISDAHCGHLGDDFVSAFAEIQFARDARMAKAMSDERASILIAGLEHVRRDRGVPFHLMRLKQKGDVVSLAFIETIPGKTDPADYDLPYDIAWFTSAKDRSDPCND